MASQTVFNHLVSSLLPAAIPSQPSHIEDFGLGRVFIFSKPPRKFIPWSKNDLKFTGWSFSSLLTRESFDNLMVTAATNLQLETKKGNGIKVNTELTANNPMRQAFEELGLKSRPGGAPVQGCIEAEFGKVTHIDTDVLFECETKNLFVKMDHPTIQQAMENGGTLFISASIYEAERCCVSISLEDMSREVVNTSGPTSIAFLLVKLSIAPDGMLKPVVNNGLFSKLQGFAPPSVQATPSGQSSHPLDSLDPARLYRKRGQSRVSLEQDGWVVIETLGAQNKSGKKDDKVPSLDHHHPPALVEETAVLDILSDEGSTHPHHHHHSLVQETATLEINEQGPPPDRSDDSDRPKVVEEFVVQESATVSNESSLLQASPPDEIPPEYNPMLDQHYVYSLKDFQPFESTDYEGIYGEVKEWVRPLVSNKALHLAFIKYINPPRTIEKLQIIEKFLMEFGNALREHKPLPSNNQPSLEPVLSAMSTKWAVQLDEVSSTIIVAEALDEFPQHIVKKALQLPADKRSTLVKFIRSTPFGVDKHVFQDEGPFKDPDLNPFMTRMGYSLPTHTHNLVLEMGFEENQDRLAAGLILMLGTDAN